MSAIRLLLLSGLMLSLFTACAPANHGYTATDNGGYVKRGKPYKIAGKWYYPLASGDFYDQTGVASWYGMKFHGKQTANGERYNMYAMTAAHTTLPMPSTVLVTNLENGKQIKVRVNDRGPFVKDRLIDLSYAAAKALGYANQGTARVRVQTLESPSMPSAQKDIAETKQAYVQVGAFSIRTSALNYVDTLKMDLDHTRYAAKVEEAAGIYRVRIGPFASDNEARLALQEVRKKGYHEAMVIHD